MSFNRIVQPVILCGGSGTRLWPLSRSGFPKQFLCLDGNRSLFQKAMLRVASFQPCIAHLAPPSIVCNEEHRFLVAEQMRELGVASGPLILEPNACNTAPALTLAALAATANGAEDPILVVTPADHAIQDQSAFHASLRQAITQAVQGNVVILGIRAERPETGYGYIKVDFNELDGVLNVKSFLEKPDIVTAEIFLKRGGYFWNSGIFVLKASVWLKALNAFRPDIYESVCAAWELRTKDGLFVRPDKEKFRQVPSESIDYSVIERCPGEIPISMVHLDADWSDLGAWDSVWNILSKDDNSNAYVGDVLSSSSSHNLVFTTSRLVSLVGVNQLVVVETPDAVLVADKSCSQDVRHIVSKLGGMQRQELIQHRKVHRPWGWYDCIDHGDCFKVKRIKVNPGASLSLQKHQNRAEHWIVVKGEAEITCGATTFFLKENQSTFIPQGEIHRLANPGFDPLEIIEVQTGNYLSEDDILRIEDNYGRT